MMGLTEEQLYNAYDGSWEQEFVNKLDKDIFGIRDKTPSEALHTLHEEGIRELSSVLSANVVEADGGELGIRYEVLNLGLVDRYIGLRNVLRSLVGNVEQSSLEIVKRMLSLLPREVLLLIKNAVTDEEVLRYIKITVRCIFQSDYKVYTEPVYYAVNEILSTEGGLQGFKSVLERVVVSIHMYEEYIYEGRIYNPSNLSSAIREDIEGDIRYLNVKGLGYEEYLSSSALSPLYLGYLEVVKPSKETKAVQRIRQQLKDRLIVDGEEERISLYNHQFVYRKSTGKLIMVRDGLTLVGKYGEESSLSASKVTVGDITKAVEWLTQDGV